MVWAIKHRPLDTDHHEVRPRSGSVASLAVLVVTTVALSWAGPAGACSIGFPKPQYLDELDGTDVVAIGQPEIVARTGTAKGWYRAGVIAFTSAWLVRGDAEDVAETVWTMNDGRIKDLGPLCRSGFDAEPVGTGLGFHVLMVDGSVLPVAVAPSPNARSLDPRWIDPAVLTERYGPAVEITPDPGLVAAAYTQLAAERPADSASRRMAILASAIVVLGLALAVARSRRPITRQQRERAKPSAFTARERSPGPSRDDGLADDE